MSSPLDGNGVAAAVDVLWPAQEWNGERAVCEAATEAAITAYLVTASASEERKRRAAGPSSVKWPMPDPLAKYRALPPSQTAVEPVATFASADDLVRRLQRPTMRGILYDGLHAEAASTLTAQAAALVAAEANAWPFGKRPNPVCGHTQGEFAVYGDEASIKKVRAAIHELDAMMPHRIERIKHEQSLREAAESEVATLKARIVELEAGLEPFAEAAVLIPPEEQDFKVIAHVPAGPHAKAFKAISDKLTAGNFRRARRLTHQEKNNVR